MLTLSPLPDYFTEKRSLREVIIFICLFFLSIGHSGGVYAATPYKHSRTQVMMGDVPVSIVIEAPSARGKKAFAAMEAAFREARDLEARVSEWNQKSDASLLNRMAGTEPIKVGRDLFRMLKAARIISQETDGAFDITFSSTNRTASYHDLMMDEKRGTAFLKAPGMSIGVSGIAKGYIIDRMGEVLKKSRFNNFLINAGGDLITSGLNGEKPWLVGIRSPDKNGKTICEIFLKNQAAATSGTYERGSHLIDPKTKKPAKSDLLSATVIAPSAMRADGLATGIYILGMEKGSRLLQRLPDVGGILIGRDGSVSRDLDRWNFETAAPCSSIVLEN